MGQSDPLSSQTYHAWAQWTSANTLERCMNFACSSFAPFNNSISILCVFVIYENLTTMFNSLLKFVLIPQCHITLNRIVNQISGSDIDTRVLIKPGICSWYQPTDRNPTISLLYWYPGSLYWSFTTIITGYKFSLRQNTISPVIHSEVIGINRYISF